eukprot:scaffold129040_cov66-Phaeocystis_antarctica.AAC.1
MEAVADYGSLSGTCSRSLAASRAASVLHHPAGHGGGGGGRQAKGANVAQWHAAAVLDPAADVTQLLRRSLQERAGSPASEAEQPDHARHSGGAGGLRRALGRLRHRHQQLGEREARLERAEPRRRGHGGAHDEERRERAPSRHADCHAASDHELRCQSDPPRHGRRARLASRRRKEAVAVTATAGDAGVAGRRADCASLD